MTLLDGKGRGGRLLQKTTGLWPKESFSPTPLRRPEVPSDALGRHETSLVPAPKDSNKRRTFGGYPSQGKSARAKIACLGSEEA